MRGSRTAALSIITLTGATLMLAGCSGGDESDTSSVAGPSRDQVGAVEPGSAEDLALSDAGVTADGTKGSGGASNGLLSEVQADRAIIANAEMTLRSHDVTATIDAIELIASSAGGFVAGRDVSSNPDDPKGTRAAIVMRVPTAKLDSVIDRVQAEGDVVRITADQQDVTEQVVDVDSRVDSARASVDRIRSLLSEATTIGEVVRIESELSRREADLESLLAQQRSLADQTSLATLSVTVLAPNAVEPPPVATTGFLPGLERGWDALVGVVVVALTTLGVLLPFIVVAALLLGPIAAAWRRRRPNPAPAARVGDAPAEREPEPVS